MAELERHPPAVPGFDPDSTGLVVVSRSGLSDRLDRDRLDVAWGPEDLLDAWLP